MGMTEIDGMDKSNVTVAGRYYTAYNVYQNKNDNKNEMKAEELGSFSFDDALALVEVNEDLLVSVN